MFNDFLGLDKTFCDVVHVIEKPFIFETIAKSNHFDKCMHNNSNAV